MAKKAYGGMQSVAGTAHKGLQKGVNSVVGTAAAWQGVGNAVNEMGAQKGWNAPQRFMRRVGGMLGLAGQGMLDRTSTFLTGMENQRTERQGKSAMGEVDPGTSKKQNFASAKEGANVSARNLYANSPDKTKKSPDKTNTAGNTNNDQPEDTKPTYDNQRDTNAT